MPELPEVETVRRVLDQKVTGLKIVDINVRYDKIVKDISILEFKNILIGKTILKMERKGKYLLFNLGDIYLVSHLRMEGKYYIKDPEDELGKHEHIIFSLSNGKELRYCDTRKFGTMHIRKCDELLTTYPINELGPEATDLDPNYLHKVLNKKIPVKEMLLDQHLISGIGNIYANEILFLCGISPKRLGVNLSLEDCKNISKYSKEVLEKAIADGGTTIRSYTSELGVTGRFQQELYCHTRDGMPCLKCGKDIIIKYKLAGRMAYECPTCQK